MAYSVIMPMPMRGTANVRPLIWIAFVSFFVVSLPLGYLFGVVMNYQLVGVWFAFPFGLTLSGVLLLYLLSEGIEQDRVWSKGIIR